MEDAVAKEIAELREQFLECISEINEELELLSEIICFQMVRKPELDKINILKFLDQEHEWLQKKMEVSPSSHFKSRHTNRARAIINFQVKIAKQEARLGMEKEPKD